MSWAYIHKVNKMERPVKVKERKMSNEELAAKLHRCKDGTRHHKAFYGRGGWYFLTGQFGKVGNATVAQARSQSNILTWVNEKGEYIKPGTPIRGMWQEVITDVTDIPW